MPSASRQSRDFGEGANLLRKKANPQRTRENMMNFCRYVLIAVLLFSTLLLAQTAAPPSPPKPSSPAAEPYPPGPYPAMSPAAEARGRQIFEMFETGKLSALWATLSDNLKKRFGTEQRFTTYLQKSREQLGTESKLLDEKITPIMFPPGTVYARLSQFAKAPAQVIATIAIDERGQLEVFMLAPNQGPPEGRFAGHKDATNLRLPFNGEWLVAQGGHSIFENEYMRSEEQRFAYDFVLLKNGRSFGGDPSKNESFYCFGQPILAPGDGTVIRVEDGYVDNLPGQPSNDAPRGNMILIAHGNREYSLLDHLKQNSAKVKKGDTVKQGEVIAECGNSGASPGPHVHFQLQNTAGIPVAEPLPAQFNDYMANGKLVANGEPVKGQTVSNAPASSAPAAAKSEPPSK
jgi:Peptidase family M23